MWLDGVLRERGTDGSQVRLALDGVSRRSPSVAARSCWRTDVSRLRPVPAATDTHLRRSVIHDALRRRAARAPHHPAVVQWDASGQRREVAYGELDRAVNLTAHRWIADGLRRGDVVAAVGGAGVEHLVAYYAALRCGAAFTGCSAAATPPELAYFIDHARPSRIVADDGLAVGLGGAIGAGVAVDPLSALWPSESVVLPEPHVDVSEDDIAMVVYTSGTESRPKGVMVTHRAFMVATTFSWVLEGYLRSWDRFLLLAPMHTMAGLGTATNIITTGATIVFAGSTSADVVRRVIQDEQVTNMSQTPAFYRRLLEEPGFDPGQLASLQQCHTYGGLAQPAVFERLSEMIPGMTWATYWGQTELSQLGSIGYFRSLDDVPRRDARWIGRAVPHLDVRVVDEEDRDSAVGELIVRSPAVMAGYLDDPRGTAAVTRDGWLRTGDLVEIDEHQNLFFLDRRKDVIKTGGMNVSSLEVEQVLMTHPAVVESAVVGLPDPTWSEAVTAFVVVAEGTAVDPEDLRLHCRHVLSPHKVPKAVHLVTALPRDSQGKLRKRLLRSGGTSGGV